MRITAVVLSCFLSGCGLVLDLEPPDQPPDAGRMDASMFDAGEIEEDAAMSCEACDDGNECTLDLCEGGVCAWENVDGLCELDGNACTPERCVDGVCTGTGVAACPSGQNCVDGQCVCPFTDLRVCGDLCISNNSCCDDGDCTLPLICSGPGGVCACPVGQRPCGDRCIDAATGCCTHSDCGTVRQCIGDVCVCPAGTSECGTGECISDLVFCDPASVPVADATCGSTCLLRPCGTNCQPAATCVLRTGAECRSNVLTNFCDRTTNTCATCLNCVIESRSATTCTSDTVCQG